MAKIRKYRVIYNPECTTKITRMVYVYAEHFLEAIRMVAWEVEPIDWNTAVAYPVDDDK